MDVRLCLDLHLFVDLYLLVDRHFLVNLSFNKEKKKKAPKRCRKRYTTNDHTTTWHVIPPRLVVHEPRTKARLARYDKKTHVSYRCARTSRPIERHCKLRLFRCVPGSSTWSHASPTRPTLPWLRTTHH